MKNVLKVTFVIIGTMIGAGFASGKEIFLFFNSYGIKGFVGVLISTLLSSYIIAKVFEIVKNKDIQNYGEFLECLHPSQKEKGIMVNTILNAMIQIFLLITFYIMIAGFSAYFSQEIGVSGMVGSILIGVLCYFTFMGNQEGIAKANTLLVPVLILMIVVLGIKGIRAEELMGEIGISYTQEGSWLVSSLLYASYNSILLIPILITMKSYIQKKRDVFSIVFLCFIVLSVLAAIIYLLIQTIPIDVNKLELPMVYIAGKLGLIFKYIYGFVILSSIFTSAISAGYSFLENTTKQAKAYRIVCFFICISSILVSKVGFSNLVSSLYPIFGYLGLIQILMIYRIKV